MPRESKPPYFLLVASEALKPKGRPNGERQLGLWTVASRFEISPRIDGIAHLSSSAWRPSASGGVDECASGDLTVHRIGGGGRMLGALRQRAKRQVKIAVANISDRFAPHTAADGLPIPPRAFRDMVRIGDHSAQTFLAQGESVATAVRSAAHKAGFRIAGEHRVFEWGCGCGRVIRHLRSSVNYLAGCDVDADLVGWVQENIDQDRFFTSCYMPPLPLDDATFDLVYSISVFTHIDQKAGDAWITELARITRPTGLLIISVLADQAIETFRITERADRGIKRSWLGNSETPAKYMDTYVNVPWLIGHWADKVDLLLHLPKAIRGKQDLLVFKPKQAS